jgi:hypothetical protein
VDDLATGYHVGGAIGFGPDGMLYMTTGDAMLPERVVARGSKLARVLRFTKAGGVPGDNPTPGDPTWAMGLRNAQSFAWLPDSSLIAVEHGPSGMTQELGRKGHDELNTIIRGADYGWPRTIGDEPAPGVTAPLFTWERAIAPTGLALSGAWANGRGSVLVAGLLRGLERVQLEREGRTGQSVSAASGWAIRTSAHWRWMTVATSLTTSSRDVRGIPRPGDDLLVRLTPVVRPALVASLPHTRTERLPVHGRLRRHRGMRLGSAASRRTIAGHSAVLTSACLKNSSRSFLIESNRAAEPGAVRLSYETRDGVARDSALASTHPSVRSPHRSYIYGDNQDGLDSDTEFMGNAVRITRQSDGDVLVQTSLSGFPPVYQFQQDDRLVIAPTIAAISDAAGAALAYSMRGVAEWIHIGQPIGHRTHFEHVTVMPAGMVPRVSPGGKATAVRTWSSPREPRFRSMPEYLEAQSTLAQAIERMDTRHSFLSLTAGFGYAGGPARSCAPDAWCAHDQRHRHSLDARRARQLCKALGVEHRIMRPDQAFFDRIDTLTEETVRRSGGLAGIEQALEVHMYRQLGGAFDSRLSGNLGNQVGRSGTEGTGMRRLSPAWFRGGGRSLRSCRRHWHQQIAATGGRMRWSSYSKAFSPVWGMRRSDRRFTQQTPYADRTLIANKLREPAFRHRRAVRTRDLMHRSLVSRRHAFKRKAVIDVGRPVAHIPSTGARFHGRPVASALIGFGAGLIPCWQGKAVPSPAAPLRQLTGVVDSVASDRAAVDEPSLPGVHPRHVA